MESKQMHMASSDCWHGLSVFAKFLCPFFKWTRFGNHICSFCSNLDTDPLPCATIARVGFVSETASARDQDCNILFLRIPQRNAYLNFNMTQNHNRSPFWHAHGIFADLEWWFCRHALQNQQRSGDQQENLCSHSFVSRTWKEIAKWTHICGRKKKKAWKRW